MRHPLCLLAALWLVHATAAQAAMHVKASLDRDHVRLGDLMTLTVTLTDSDRLSADPNFGVLSPDFDVLSTSRSVRVGIEHGRATMNVRWIALLRPRRAGSLTIPRLRVNGQISSPLTLTVSEASPTSAADDAGPVFVRATTGWHDPYVGQQVILTVRLFHSVPTNGSLKIPQGQGFDIRDLGDNAHYTVARSGREYQVDERHYAVIPQNTGRVQLPPVTFEGYTFSDAMAGQDNSGQPVQVQSAPIDFDVRSIPPDAENGTWLPAQKVSLTLTGLPADGQVEVGQPLPVTLTERATGLPSESLPVPTLPRLDGAGVYPDEVEGKTIGYGKWLHGERSREFVFIPQVTGPLTIPKITLHWWNVNTDEMDEAVIPSRTLTAVPAEGGATSGGGGNASGVSATLRQLPHAILRRARSGSRWWMLVLFALGLAGGMAGIAVWIGRYRQRWATGDAPRSKPASRRRLRAAFLRSARAGDVTAQAECLLAWARTERSELRSLGDLAAALESPEQRTAIAALQRARYSPAGGLPKVEALEAVFRGGLDWRRPVKANPSPLPPLYP